MLVWPRLLSVYRQEVNNTRKLYSLKIKLLWTSSKAGRSNFLARVSAVAIKAGTSLDLKYQDGVAIFTKVKGGLMAEASAGGQKFKYQDGIEN